MSVDAETSDLSTLSLAEESPISAIISDIKSRAAEFTIQDFDTCLHDYKHGLDKFRVRIYMEAKVKLDSLDTGCDPSDLGSQCAMCYAVEGDIPAQYFSKKLGGDGLPRNIFAMNAELDRTLWDKDQDLVYNYIKEEKNRSAILYYGIEFDKEAKYKISRPYKIYYKFQLLQNDKIDGEAIEGIVVNSRKIV